MNSCLTNMKHCKTHPHIDCFGQRYREDWRYLPQKQSHPPHLCWREISQQISVPWQWNADQLRLTCVFVKDEKHKSWLGSLKASYLCQNRILFCLHALKLYSLPNMSPSTLTRGYGWKHDLGGCMFLRRAAALFKGCR